MDEEIQQKKTEEAAAKHRHQLELSILESEYASDRRKKEQLEVELRELKAKKNKIDFAIFDKEKELKRIEGEMFSKENDIRMLKKKIRQL